MKQFVCRRKAVGSLVLAAVAVIISMKSQLMMFSSSITTMMQGGSMDDSHEKVPRTENRREEIGQLAKHESYVNRWDRRFSSSAARGKQGGYVFLKHIRKAGGTSLRTYIRNAFEHHGLSRNVSILEQLMTNQTLSNNYDISYVEQEFEPMDWQCSAVDPRWQESLNIIVLRHPIERHLSEFFFSGVTPATKNKIFGKNRRIIQKDQLFLNKTYTNILARFIYEEVPRWMEYSKIGRKRKYKATTMFARWYQDNFQLRALAGCSSGQCLMKKVTEQSIELRSIHDLHPLNHSYITPSATCTHFFRENSVYDVCSTSRKRKITDQCSTGCDVPCSYPTIAEGSLDKRDVRHAIKSLQAFDVVLLMEHLLDDDQSAFLNDVMGVPRDALFALNNARKMNANVFKSNKREVTHFYRDLFTKLNLQSVLLRLEEENKLEIEFFNRAVDVYNQQMKLWKEETGWGKIE